MLHVLLHMTRSDLPFTSEQIAVMLETNAVVVRRTMAGLRNSGYVKSSIGQGGGWTIACDMTKTTLLDIYMAVGGTRLVAIGVDKANPSCAVERVVNAAVSEAILEAERLLLMRLGEISLSDLADHFGEICETESDCKCDGPALVARHS
jgi:DNA-binding IscR family transcriptional regulator